MFRKLIRKIIRPIVGKNAAAVIAEAADRAIVREADKVTGGVASKVDEAL